MKRKLRRVKGNKNHWLGGVCAGIAYWLGIPTWIVRLACTVVTLFYGIGALIYVLLWIFMPKWENEPENYKEITSS